LLLITFSNAYSQNLDSLYGAAVSQQKQHDYGGALETYNTIDQLLPNHPTVLAQMAKCASVVDESYAVSILKRLSMINADTALLSDSLIRQMSSLEEVKILFNEVNSPLSSSEVLFKITDPFFHPEGIAASAQGDSIYVSSIRKGIIRVFDRKGRVLNTISDPRFAAVSGLALDDGTLWVTSPPAPQYEDYDSLQTSSMVFKVDLKTMEVIEIPVNLEGASYLGDLAVDAHGKVWITDSSTPRVLIIANNHVEHVIQLEGFRSIQGVCFGGGRIYFSDYREGLLCYDQERDTTTILDLPEGLSTKGTDGIYFYDNSIITIQNGVNPRRITQLFLDDGGVSGYRYLEKANSQLNEPTLGVVVGDDLIYVGNSPWGLYNRDNSLLF